MRRFRDALAKRLDEVATAARQDVPAQNIRNQLPGTTLPPGGPSGDGYPPLPSDSSTTGGIQLANDLGGTATAPLVVGWQDVLLNLASPSDGDIAQYSSATGKWELVSAGSIGGGNYVVAEDGTIVLDEDGEPVTAG